MHVRFDYDNVSFEKGGSPKKNDPLWGGGGKHEKKNED